MDFFKQPVLTEEGDRWRGKMEDWGKSEPTKEQAAVSEISHISRALACPSIKGIMVTSIGLMQEARIVSQEHRQGQEIT